MKILFDHQIFVSQKNGGISRFFCNLIDHLKQEKNTEILLPVVEHENEYLKEFTNIVNPKIAPSKIQKFLKKDQNFAAINSFFKSGNFDIFHPTYYSKYFFEHLKNKPFVTTIHDMTYELYPEFFSPKDQTANLKLESAKKAKKIIVVSENTKKDLIRLTDIKEDKIAVIAQACSLNTSINIDRNLLISPSQEYLLFVGTRGIYKNFYFTVLAIEQTLKNNPNLNLLCFGQPFNKKEKTFLASHGLDKKIFAVQGNDSTLVGLYKNALAFLAPSYCEGFYVTLLEAFACGCPVLASNKEPIPEVAGDAAIYFDAKDNLAIKASVEKIISDSDLRKKMSAKGLERNKLFTWQNVARQTRELYESIV